MKKILFCLTMGLLWLSSCTRPVQRKAEKSPFIIDVLLKTTPVKDQGRSTLCWVYAMLATIETNHLMQGDSVNLSPNYIARRLMMDEMRRCYLAYGAAPLRLRGMGPRLLALLSAYGVVPYDSYSTLRPVNLNVLALRLQRATQTVHNFASLDAQGNRLLDEALGYLPGACSVCKAAERCFGRAMCRQKVSISPAEWLSSPRNTSRNSSANRLSSAFKPPTITPWHSWDWPTTTTATAISLLKTRGAPTTVSMVLSTSARPMCGSTLR